MNRLVIQKSINQKTLFRVTGRAVYKQHYWDIATTKDELVAYITQFQPDLISIGTLPDMTAQEVALYLRNVFLSAKMKIPTIISFDPVLSEELKRIIQGK